MKYSLLFGREGSIILDSKEIAIRQADVIAKALLNFSLIEEMKHMWLSFPFNEENSEMQNIFVIPDYFVNLLLGRCNMGIMKCEEKTTTEETIKGE